MTRATVIQECIDHLRGQPGRNAIRALKRLLAETGQQTPAADHDQQVVKVWQLNGMADWRAMADRCQGAMLSADSCGRRDVADDYALLYLIARRQAWESEHAAQSIQQEDAQ